MVVIREVRHPLALDFANERLVYHLRKDEKKSWDYIAANVENNSGEPSTRATVQRAYLRFSVKNGKSAYKFANCGRFAWKLTPAIEKFLLRKLLCLRKKMICTSVTLQGILAKEKGVQLADSAIRKFLISEGYKWSPRAQKRLYSEKDMAKRYKFSVAVAKMSLMEIRKKLALSMDGVILTTPPTDPTDLANYCHNGETHMWRKDDEAALPELAGGHPYADQIPLSRALPLWGGISEGGFAEVVMHKKKKLTIVEWLRVVEGGKLTDAIRSLKPSRQRPFHVLCDNEKFLKSKLCAKAYKDRKVKLWFVPPRSPDLNPVERFWSWLRRELRRRDLQDFNKKTPVLGKMAYRRRVRAVLKSSKAQQVAKNVAKGFKKVCQKVVAKGGAHSGK